MSSAPTKTAPPPEDERPPLLGSWKRLYTLVLIGNLIWLALAFFITQAYS